MCDMWPCEEESRCRSWLTTSSHAEDRQPDDLRAQHLALAALLEHPENRPWIALAPVAQELDEEAEHELLLNDPR